MTAVSNSRTQKELIDLRARERSIRNLDVITADVVDFETDRKFNRVLSIEMFEHMKNYKVRLPDNMIHRHQYSMRCGKI